eukprot:INCI10154.1.p1 GENE.INCI10154.1~~INCI10154.1.p1  ORF type:complete len:310 (+),score=57.78 INCI10154.1:171-1100(+)
MDAGTSASAGRVAPVPVPKPPRRPEAVQTKEAAGTRKLDRKLVRIQVPFYVSDDDAGRAKALEALGGEKAVHSAIREDSLGSLVCQLRPQDPQAHALRLTFSQETEDPALVFKVVRKNGVIVRTEILGTLPAGGHATFSKLADFQFLHENSFQDGLPSTRSAASRTVADPVPFDPLPLYFAQHPQFAPPPKNDAGSSVPSAHPSSVTTDAAVAQSNTSSQPESDALPSGRSDSPSVKSTMLSTAAKRPAKRKAEMLAKPDDSLQVSTTEKEEEQEDEAEDEAEDEDDFGNAHAGLLKEMQGVESYDLLM